MQGAPGLPSQAPSGSRFLSRVSISHRLVAVVSGSALTLSMLTRFSATAHSAEMRAGPVGTQSDKCDQRTNPPAEQHP